MRRHLYSISSCRWSVGEQDDSLGECCEEAAAAKEYADTLISKAGENVLEELQITDVNFEDIAEIDGCKMSSKH